MMRGLWVLIAAHNWSYRQRRLFGERLAVKQSELLSIVAASGKQLADTGRSCGGAQYRIWRW